MIGLALAATSHHPILYFYDTMGCVLYYRQRRFTKRGAAGSRMKGGRKDRMGDDLTYIRWKGGKRAGRQWRW